ncbi:MAG: hypothetical protein U9R21_07440, partial [Candidatus Thermoplasmatota archaeon]|nr:hypothetical protein [Candidatus Thermoplasmatota archaeon]
KERNNNPDTLLFLSQTVSDAHMRRSCKGNFTYIGRHEKDAIIEIVNNFDRLAEHFGVHKMKIRLHPSERQFRHKDIIKRHEGLEFEVEQAHDCELLESIANTRVVIGMTSIALFISYICGKPTISFIPEASVKCTLPLPPEICVHSISEICRIPYETFTKHGEQINLFLNRNLESLFMKIEKGQAL